MNTKPRLHSPTLLLRTRLRRLEYELERCFCEWEDTPAEPYTEEWNSRITRAHDLRKAWYETRVAIENRKYRRG